MSYEAYKVLFEYLEGKGEVSIGKYQLVYGEHPFIPACIEVKEDSKILHTFFNDPDSYDSDRVEDFNTLTDYMEEVKKRKKENNYIMPKTVAEVFSFLQ